MPKPTHKYLKIFKDRHGRERVYYCRLGINIALRHRIGSAQFEAEYKKAEEQVAERRKDRGIEKPPRLARKGTDVSLAEACRKAAWRAVAKGSTSEMNVTFLVGLFEAQQGKCAVSGLPMNPNAKGRGEIRDPFAVSLDRIDSQRGYTKDNVRLVCLAVNTALNQWGDEVLFRVARAICAKELSTILRRWAL